MLKIVVAPNALLGRPGKEVKIPYPKEIFSILKQMEETLNNANDPRGVGLAAPQVGIPLQIFIAKPTEKSKISVFINPKIVETEQAGLPAEALAKAGPRAQKVKKLEGCLSLPNIWGEVKRNPSVTLSYFDRNGKKLTKEFKGFMATIIQHEADHLQGILFPKHVLSQKGRLYKSEKNEKNEDEFEEIEI